MPDHFLFKLIFSLVSGFTAFLGVDTAPHQMLFAHLSGQGQLDPVMTLCLRFGALMALIVACWGRISRLLRERRIALRLRRRHKRQSDPVALLDLQLIKTAVIPLLISVLFYRRAGELVANILTLSLTLVLNGIVLFIPRLISSGNKDGRSVSRLDAIIIGLGGALAAIPGFSPVGGLLTASAVQGLDRTYAMDIALLLCIPLLAALLIFDVFAVIAARAFVSLITGLVYLLFTAVSFGGAWLGIVMMRYLSQKIGFAGFAYYSWGFALFTFILYLII